MPSMAGAVTHTMSPITRHWQLNRRLAGSAFQPEHLANGFRRKVFLALDDFHDTGAAQAVAVAIEHMVDSFVNLNAMKKRHLAQVRIIVRR